MACCKTDQALDDHTKDFCENTSAHALGQIFQKSNKFRRAFWTVVFIGACAGCIFHIYYTVDLYLKYGNSLKTKTVHDPINLEFPSVTVCNLDPISISQWAKPATDKFINDMGFFNETCDNEFARPLEQKPVEMILRFRNQPKFWFEYNSSIADIVGHTKSNFIVDCQFLELPGCEQYFNVTRDQKMFNCYTFEPPPGLPAGLAIEEGLSLTLFLENDSEEGVDLSLLPVADNSYRYGNVGVKVYVHRRGSRPSITGGFIAEVGKTNNVAVTMVKTEALRSPFPLPCNTNEFITSSSEVPKLRYSAELCESECIQATFAERCGCVSIEYGSDKLGHDVPYCGSYPCDYAQIRDNYKCMAGVFTEYLNGTIMCALCTEPCNDIKYSTRHFSSKWPSKHYGKKFIQQLVSGPKNNTVYAETLRNMTEDWQLVFIENNFVRLNVHFDTYSTRIEEQSLDMDWFGLLSNVGGAFGFWVGVSVCTGVEALEFLLGLMVLLVNKCTGKSATEVVCKQRVESSVHVNPVHDTGNC